MAGRKVGTVTYKRDLSPILTIFRLMPEAGSLFPPSKAGQYIALRRDDCKLTKKLGKAEDGSAIYGPALDEDGNQKIGQVTHSYSIASAPWGTGGARVAGILRGAGGDQEGRVRPPQSRVHEHGSGDGTTRSPTSTALRATSRSITAPPDSTAC